MPTKASPPWPALKIEMWPLDKVRAYPRNPRTHSPEQVEQLAASYRKFGWTVPMLVDEKGEIIAGHGREAMAAKVGLKTVPVVVAKGWTDDQKKAYRIADNQLALASDWNDLLLKSELEVLKLGDFDTSVIGFTDGALSTIFNGWTSDIDLKGTHGTHTNGIDARIVVVVGPKDGDKAKDVITGALTKAGIKFELG